MKNPYIFDTINGKNVTLKRVNSRVARAVYRAGLDLLIIPYKCSPLNHFWIMGEWINSRNTDQTFMEIKNSFEYYNCNHETGYYSAFYIPVVGVDRWTNKPPTATTENIVEIYDYDFRRA